MTIHFRIGMMGSEIERFFQSVPFLLVRKKPSGVNWIAFLGERGHFQEKKKSVKIVVEGQSKRVEKYTVNCPPIGLDYCQWFIRKGEETDDVPE